MAKYDLETLRHSTAHIMAQAIQELFPNENVKLGIGPVIENGFYYDIEMNARLNDEDLPRIEQQMKNIIKRDEVIERHSFSDKNEALDFFNQRGQTLKAELISDMSANEEITYYTHGESFFDLCRGPHVERTSHIPPFFKLLNTAGAYWRGNESRPMLQRVYAACFNNKNDLKEHLNFLEEAKKRDHRKLGKELDLFLFQKEAPASPFFLPKGTFVYLKLQDFVKQILRKYQYQEVLAPQVLDVDLWHTSGHYENYKENMYFTEVDNREFALKPMNCPGHMLMYRYHKHSYRELPLRYAEFGKVHRYEKSGVVAGLTRVRAFTQDDAHIFLAPEQIEQEVLTLLEMFFITYEHFQFKKFKVNLSTRPEKKIGDDSIWELSENALRAALDKFGHPYEIKEGDGAFYGPKIDFDIADALNRYHQLGTIQLDFNLPERFDLNYTTSEGSEQRVVVIHRALLGSLERFFGVYLEHVAGAFPFWIAPEQIIIVPVNNELHLDYCQALQTELEAIGLRVRVDDRNESMGFKTRQIQKSKAPFMCVIGDKEIEQQKLNLRRYGEKNSVALDKADAFALFKELDSEFIPKKFRT